MQGGKKVIMGSDWTYVMLRSFLNIFFFHAAAQFFIVYLKLNIYLCKLALFLRCHIHQARHSLKHSLPFVRLCTINEIRRSCGACTGTSREIPSLGRNAGRTNPSGGEGGKGQQRTSQSFICYLSIQFPEMLLL